MVTKHSFKAALRAILVGCSIIAANILMIIFCFTGQAFFFPLTLFIGACGALSVSLGINRLYRLYLYKKEKRRRFAPCPSCGNDFCCDKGLCCTYCGEKLADL